MGTDDRLRTDYIQSIVDSNPRTGFPFTAQERSMAKELLELRAAKRADEEQIREVVREAWWHAMGQHTDESIAEADWSELRDAIASRVASRLAGSVGVGLSENERDVILKMRLMIPAEHLTPAQKMILDDILSPTRPDPLSAIRSILDNDDQPAGQLRAELRRIVGG